MNDSVAGVAPARACLPSATDRTARRPAPVRLSGKEGGNHCCNSARASVCLFVVWACVWVCWRSRCSWCGGVCCRRRSTPASARASGRGGTERGGAAAASAPQRRRWRPARSSALVSRARSAQWAVAGATVGGLRAAAGGRRPRRPGRRLGEARGREGEQLCGWSRGSVPRGLQRSPVSAERVHRAFAGR